MPKIIPQWWIDQTFKYAAFEHERDLPSLEGKVAIVTGASAGLGAETCLVLAKKGAHVFCMGRSKDKTMAVVDNIINTTGNRKVEFLQADFMDLKSVEKAANEFLSRQLPLHILVNNAGIMACPYALSKDGIESQMATNHFAHALLTNILLPVIQASQPSRIVNLSSDAHRAFSRKGGINYDELVDEKKYKSAVRYGETKIANIHFTIELQERLDAEARRQGYTQSQVYVNACHPGIVATELSRSLGTTYGRGTDIARSRWTKAYNLIAISVSNGAINQLYLAASDEVEQLNLRAKYLVPYLVEELPTPDARDPDQAKKTWFWTEQVLQKHYDSSFKWKL